MRLRHYTFLFAILFGSIVVIIQLRQSREEQLAWERECFEHCITYAADMAAEHMVRYEDEELQVDCEGALEAFFCNLAAGLGVLDQPGIREQLTDLVRCAVVTDREGYYLWHTISDEHGLYQHVWEPKRYFVENGKNQTECIEEILNQESKGEVSLYLPEADENFWVRGSVRPGFYVLVQGFPGRTAKEYDDYFFSASELYKYGE